MGNRWHLGVVTCWLVAGVAGCGGGFLRDGDHLQRPGNPDIVGVSGDDPEMNKAIDTSRKTVDQFITALKSPKPGQDHFTVKAKFGEGNNIEHMWIDPVRFDGAKFVGNLSNEPEFLKSPKLGDEVSVAKDQISDWMYVDKGHLVGGYSVRLLRDRATPEERKRLDEEVGYRFD
jgi:uncharacterized protein YegJ (DUF2314 family)